MIGDKLRYLMYIYENRKYSKASISGIDEKLHWDPVKVHNEEGHYW